VCAKFKGILHLVREKQATLENNSGWIFKNQPDFIHKLAVALRYNTDDY